MQTKPGAILKFRLAQSKDLSDSEMVTLPADVNLITDGKENGHYRVIGYVWEGSVEVAELRTNEAGLNLIKEFEGLRLRSYQCSAGVWTIGYGTTRIDGRPVQPGMTITKNEAESLFEEDIRRFESGVKLQLRVLGLDESNLNSNQFSALVSLCYNCGLSPISPQNTIGRELADRNYSAAALGFLLWDKATVNGQKVRLEGLTRRRKREKELFEQ